MPWWGWIAAGALLLAGELMVDAEFYLIFLGAAALATGALALGGVELPVWGQFLAFSVISIVLLVSFRRRVYQKIRGSTADLAEGVTGQEGVAQSAIEPGAEGTIELRGSDWTARNASDAPIAAGGRVVVTAARGFRLDVRGA